MSNPWIGKSASVTPSSESVGLVIIADLVAEHPTPLHHLGLRVALAALATLHRASADEVMARVLDIKRPDVLNVCPRGRRFKDTNSTTKHEDRVLWSKCLRHHLQAQRRFVRRDVDFVCFEKLIAEVSKVRKLARAVGASVVKIPRHQMWLPVARASHTNTCVGRDVECGDERLSGQR